jgi:SSS family solute:Na+ symporter
VVALYLLFSSLGLASAQGAGSLFMLLMAALAATNLAVWFWELRPRAMRA